MDSNKKRSEKINTEKLLKDLDTQNKALRKILKKLAKEKNSNHSNY